MPTETAAACRTGAELREYLLNRLNLALRRPGMFGAEIALIALGDAIAYADRRESDWQDERDTLDARGASSAVGVLGTFTQILPAGSRCDDAVASVYAELAHRCGWLRLDRALSDDEYAQLRDDLAAWGERDWSLSQLLTRLGQPSGFFGGTSPYYPKTIAYATGRGDDPLVCFHLWNSVDLGAPGELRSVFPEPMLMAVRYGDGPFLETFTYTPEGAARRPGGPA